jgi:hypothetical protein
MKMGCVLISLTRKDQVAAPLVIHTQGNQESDTLTSRKPVLINMNITPPYYPSIFNDVIGPVMRGPSSSHCAAAVRIGRIARDLMDARIEEVLILACMVFVLGI